MDQQSPLGRDSFEQILATAWVLQQFQKRASYLGANESEGAPQLVDLANAQQAIQTGSLSPEAALLRIAELALELVPAQGAAVWLFAGDNFAYRAGAGTASDDERLRTAVLSRLVTGKSYARSDVSNDAPRRSPAESLLVAPIYQGPTIAGALAIFSENANSFSERDVTNARLLTGLLAHAVDKAASAELKRTVSLERAVILHVIEKVVPNLAGLVEQRQQQQALSAPTATSARNRSANNIAARIGNPPVLVAEVEKGGEAPAPVEDWEILCKRWLDTHDFEKLESAEEVPVVIQKLSPVESGLTAHTYPPILPAALEQEVCASHGEDVSIRGGLAEAMPITFLPVEPVPDQSKSTDLSLSGQSVFGPSARSHAVDSAGDGQLHIYAFLLGKWLASRRLDCRRMHDWAAKNFTPRLRQRKDYATQTKLRLGPARLVKVRHVAIVAAALAVLAFMIFKIPKARPSVRAATTPSLHIAQAKAENTVLDVSHNRVTDSATSALVNELSPFEIPGLMRQARYGDDSAAFILGMAYEIGHGVRQNCATAANWVRDAAIGGNVAAEYNLSLRYRDGDGVPVNSGESEKWLRKAAAQKYSKAQTALAASTANQTSAALSQRKHE